MVWRILAAGAGAGTSPSPEAMITETEGMLARFHTLSPTELGRLAEQFDAIASWADDLAEQEEGGGESDR